MNRGNLMSVADNQVSKPTMDDAASSSYKPNWFLGLMLCIVAPVFFFADVMWAGNVDGVSLFLLPLSLVAGWIWAVITVGNYARSKGYSKAGFVVFAIFFPLIALIVVLVIQPSTVQREQVAAAILDALGCRGHCRAEV